MVLGTVNNLDYLVTRLHARRSRMAEGERLDSLCGCRSLPELCHARYPGDRLSAADLQRRLVHDLVHELSDCVKHLDDEGAQLLGWMLTRFQVENLKVILRGFLNGTPLEALAPHLVLLPAALEWDSSSLARAESITEFIERLPPGAPRRRLSTIVRRQPDHLRPFFLEAALDSGYLHELLGRARQVTDEDRDVIHALVLQEANLFQLMLGVRGKFHYHLAPDSLQPLAVAGDGTPDQWFQALLAAPDVPSAAKCAVGHAVDELPPDRSAGETAGVVPALEALAWKRFLRLANSAFRRSHMGLGAVVGYAGVRRVEVANLITLSEGIRTGLDAEKLRARLIPRTDLEGADV